MEKLLIDLNKRLDHAALKPETAESDILALCSEAMRYHLLAVAVNPVWVGVAKEALAGSEVHIVTVAGFPLGASRPEVKVAEAIHGVSDGAHEIDMVANIGWLVSQQFAKVEKEIALVRKNLSYNVLLKVIVEAGLLSSQQQTDAVRAVINGGAQFVKTSTGFFGRATAQQVTTLVEAAGGRIEVKASGGIRTLDDCRVMLDAGATRLGTSASADIMREYLNLGNV